MEPLLSPGADVALARFRNLYSDGAAAALGEHAAASYLSPEAYRAEARRAGWPWATVVENAATQVALAVSPGRAAVITARGTSQRRDWHDNLGICRVRWPRLIGAGRVHAGFRAQARRVEAVTRAALQALNGLFPGQAVWITGHSLGGAIAPFLALMAAEEGVEVAGVVTFNSPRVGDVEWEGWYDATTVGRRTWRVVVMRRGVQDLVSRVPLRRLGWRHVGRPVVISDGRRHEGADAWDRARAEHRMTPVEAWRVLSRLQLGIQAHLASTLVAELRAVAAAPGAT